MFLHLEMMMETQQETIISSEVGLLSTKMRGSMSATLMKPGFPVCFICNAVLSLIVVVSQTLCLQNF